MKIKTINLRKRLLRTLSIVLIMFATVSCNDEDTLSKSQLLTSSPWVIDQVNSGDPATDTFYLGFLADATFTFNTNGTYSFVFANTPDDNGSGDWEFNHGETIIYLDKGTTDEEEWTVISITSTHFKFLFVDSDPNIGSVEITFKH